MEQLYRMFKLGDAVEKGDVRISTPTHLRPVTPAPSLFEGISEEKIKELIRKFCGEDIMNGVCGGSHKFCMFIKTEFTKQDYCPYLESLKEPLKWEGNTVVDELDNFAAFLPVEFQHKIAGKKVKVTVTEVRE